MTSMDALNFQSLNMVREELVATIENSARLLEEFVTTQENEKSLQQCIDGIKQINGILKLIQFRGAAMLAEELFAVANEIAPGSSGAKFERVMEVVSSSFFVLSRYLEYVQQTERKVPVLLVPQINELRKMRSEPAIAESHFFQINLNNALKLPEVDRFDLAGKPLAQVVKRLRHMYQVGLLGLIRERQMRSSLAMMRRAMIRLHRIGGSDKPLSLLWWLAEQTLDAIPRESMSIIESRKLLFGRIDRVMHTLEEKGESAFNAEPPKGLIKELVYLLSLSGSEKEAASLVRNAFGITIFPYSDKDLAQERDALNGPSAHTVSSLSRVLQLELANTKKVLESASQSSSQQIDDIEGFVGTLDKVAEILSIVGLTSPSKTLKEEIVRVSAWKDKPDGPDAEDLSDVANTLLYLESTVQSLETIKLSDEKLEKANKIAQQEVIASGELAIAKRIVIEECEAAISLTKRALTSFSDSNFDNGHIRNIAKSLNTVRGGMLMLSNHRAANILELCVRFVDEVLMDQDPPAALKELMETFADAIIAVEYYLDSVTSSLHMDDSVLQIAEESMEALGFSTKAEG